MDTSQVPGAPDLFEAARAMGVPFSGQRLPRGKRLALGDLSLHYLDWGTAGAPAVVLLHGAFQTAHSWDFVALALSDAYRVIALDQRGHGESDWASEGDYSLEVYQRDLHRLIQALALDRPVLVGLSMGGRNALVYTAQHSTAVSALVVVDYGGRPRPEGVQRIRRFVNLPDVLDSFEAFVERTREYNPRRSLAQIRGSLQHNLKRLPDGRWTWKYDPLLREMGRTGPALDVWELLPTVRCPTLIVRGGESDVLDPATAQAMAERIPGARLVTVPGAGHLVPGDSPAAFVQELRCFLGKLPAAPKGG